MLLSWLILYGIGFIMSMIVAHSMDAQDPVKDYIVACLFWPITLLVLAYIAFFEMSDQ